MNIITLQQYDLNLAWLTLAAEWETEHTIYSIYSQVYYNYYSNIQTLATLWLLII